MSPLQSHDPCSPCYPPAIYIASNIQIEHSKKVTQSSTIQKQTTSAIARLSSTLKTTIRCYGSVLLEF